MSIILRRWRHRASIFGLVVTSLATLVALTASPASAASRSVDFLECGSPLAQDGDEVFNSVATFGGTAHSARGEGGGEPDLNEVHEDLPAGAKGKGGPAFKASVPVYFHVVHDGGKSKLTQEQVDAQMTVLNLAFGGFYGGAKTGFSFKLAAVTYTKNVEWLNAGAGGKAERNMKKALRRGGANALNLYSTTAGPYLGWAYLPSILKTRPYLDGIVVDWESMPGTSTRYAGRYDLGQTATHEAGHWLNLEHTFYHGCSANGDFVDDTPPMKIPTSGCPEGKDTCTAPGLDPIHNYMDYSYDSCYYEFSNGQSQRMKDSWLYWRA